MNQDQQLRSALIEVLDGLGALSSPHELEGYGIDAERAKEIVGLTAQQAAPSQGAGELLDDAFDALATQSVSRYHVDETNRDKVA